MTRVVSNDKVSTYSPSSSATPFAPQNNLIFIEVTLEVISQK